MNPYWTAEGILGVGYLMFCAALVFFRISKSKKFQTIDFSLLSMGIVYGGLFPLVVHSIGAVEFPGSGFISESTNYTFVHTFAAFIGAIALLIGWQSVSNSKLARYRSYFSNTSVRSATFWLYVMVVVAFATQYLYTLDYNGFIGYFAYNRLIRSSIFDGFELSRFSFLRPFGSFATLACISFWGLIISGRRGPPIILGFIISLVEASYFLYASAGRISMVSLLAIFPMSLMLKYRISYISWFFIYFGIASLGIVSLYAVSNILQIKGADNILFYVAREASFPFASFFANLREGFLFHSFLDVLVSPAYLAPSSLTLSWIPNASDINTTIIMGAVKGVDGVTGGIPTDMLTFGLMQFHFLGILIYSIILGYIFRIVSETAQSFNITGLSYAFSSYVMLKVGVFSLFYSQPKHIIMSHFSIIATLIVAVALRLFRKLLMKAYR